MLSSDEVHKIQELISINNFPSIDLLKEEIRTKIEKFEKSNCECNGITLEGSNIFILFKPKS